MTFFHPLSLRAALTTSLLSGLLLLSGCSFFNSPSDEAPQGETVLYQGTLQSLGGVRLESEATHLFVREDGTVFYATSTVYDLSDADYANRLLSISGTLTKAEDEKAKDLLRIEGLGFVSLTNPSPTPITRDTYVNERLGFAMMVRSDWTIKESAVPEEVTFRSPFAPAIDPELPPLDPLTSTDEVTILKPQGNPEGMPIEEWVKFYGFEGAGEIPVPYVRQVVSADQFPAIRIDSEGVITYYIAVSDQVFTLNHSEQLGDGNDTEYAVLFADMLYSFDPLADGQRAESAPAVEPQVDEVDEPSNEESTESSASFPIPTDFAVLESSTLHLRMGYPKLWYWSRSGLSILFTETGESEIAVVTLEILEGEVDAYSDGVSGDIIWAKAPRDDSTYYRVSGDVAYESEIKTMAKIITRFDPPAAE